MGFNIEETKLLLINVSVYLSRGVKAGLDCVTSSAMNIKHQLAGLVENRRLLLLVVLLFVVGFSVQYVELPHRKAFFSLFGAGKFQVVSVGNFSAGDSSSSFSSAKSSGDQNLTSFDGLNSTHHIYGISEAANLSDGKDAIEEHSVDSLDSGPDSDPEDESPSKDNIELNHTVTVTDVIGINNSPAPEKAGEDPQNIAASAESIDRQSIAPSLVENENVENVDTRYSISTPSVTILPSDSPRPVQAPADMGTNSRAPLVSFDPSASSVHKAEGNTIQITEIPGSLRTDLAPSFSYSSVNSSRRNKKNKSKRAEGAVVSLSEMNDMQISKLTSYHAEKPKWTSSSDQELLLAKSLVESSSSFDNDPSLHAPLFRNFSRFKRSYELMEKTLKVYIYKEGQRPIFHTPKLKGIYASEGWFMKLLKASKKFVTKDPKRAHLFYLPFSTLMLEETLYVPNSHSRRNLIQCLNNYLNLISSRYSFWNRTGGADHFLVACHDWAPAETRKIMANCIRALCNSDIREGFQFGKDVTLAETYVRVAQKPLLALGGQPPSKRQILAFFAGSLHGYLRPILLQHWENKDPDMKIFGRLPMVNGQMSYIEYMKSSKYCICAKGYEVNSPRVVEAIFYECVPVIISDNYVPPFFETFNWESFAVFVPEKDIPNLKSILVSIPQKRYLHMQRRVKLVQQHFLWHPKPIKYDIFHMILHSIWYTRVFQLSSS